MHCRYTLFMFLTLTFFTMYGLLAVSFTCAPLSSAQKCSTAPDLSHTAAGPTIKWQLSSAQRRFGSFLKALHGSFA